MQAKRVLVSGASRGIGRAIAVSLGRAGFAVTLTYKQNRDAAEQALKEVLETGSSASLLAFDVADRDATRRALEMEVEANGPFYGVVNNAGVTADRAFPAMTGDDWDRVLRTNLDGFYNLVHPLVMPMVRAHQGGRIVAISSVSGLRGNRGQVNYAASKAGLVGAVRSLALELAKRKITVNCVAPGLIETEMLGDLPREQVKALVPMQRLGKASEVGDTVAFLFSQSAAYITGEVISVDGGLP